MAKANSPNFDDLDLDLDFEENDSRMHPLKLPLKDLHNRQILMDYPNRYYHTKEDIVFQQRIGSGVAFISLVAENLLSHPFQVLKRQCQVNYSSTRYHLLPFTLIEPVYRLHQNQGLSTLWKGLGSVLLVRGVSLGVEDLISKITPWPKEITWNCSLKEFFQHTLLKCVSIAIVTPFYAASFVETVQSEIASDKPAILDVFKEGFMRLMNWGGIKGRLLPIWMLVLPTVSLGLAKYLFSMMVKSATIRILHARFVYRHELNGALPRNLSHTIVMQDLNLTAQLISNIATDVTFYPCETIIHRLYLQGTRTIVDNLDTGRSVLPILTNFTGAIDCYEKCIANEGKLGLYKGFGALILQHTAHIALVSISKLFLTNLVNLLKPKRPSMPAPPPADISPAALSNLTVASHGTYLLP